MSKDHGPSIRKNDTYEALLDKGYDKQKAAAIANGQANESMSPSEKGGEAPPYEDWTKEELLERARELDVCGRSGMSKEALIEALRN